MVSSRISDDKQLERGDERANHRLRGGEHITVNAGPQRPSVDGAGKRPEALTLHRTGFASRSAEPCDPAGR
jgi:hypothetical protein